MCAFTQKGYPLTHTTIPQAIKTDKLKLVGFVFSFRHCEFFRLKPLQNSIRNKSIRYRVGIPAHRSACGVDYLLIFKKIPPYRAVGG
ncbi:MAG: hypothetical protein IJV35_02060 [Neisseriaceae bacterium]|nr:hypothetical protein [Neisseriaceae bacterium]